tara:strand:+ start:476 stop:1381 length:906 start_codon:yes stop_codon:yes gene_type:complete
MAYKFQLGDAVMSGALEQEGDLVVDGGLVSASAGMTGSSLRLGHVQDFYVNVDGALKSAGEINTTDLVDATLGFKVAGDSVVDDSRNITGVAGTYTGALSGSAGLTLLQGVTIDGSLSASANCTVLGNVAADGNGTFGGNGDFDGTLTSDGNFTANANATFGDAVTDTVTFIGRIADGSNIIPIADGTSDLGTTGLRFGTIYVDNIVGADTKLDVATVAGGGTIASGVDFALISSGNGTTVTLPAPSAGLKIYVKLSGNVGDVVLAAATDEFIENSASIRLESTGSAVTLVAYDAIDWKIM